MADLIDFWNYYEDEADPADMDRSQLLDYLEQIRAQIEALDQQEPRNMDSKAYDQWAERHEALEDLEDDVLDRLDEMA